MPWGTRSIVLGGETVEFPKLARKNYVELMLRDYAEYYSKDADHIQNSSFKKFSKSLTSHDQKAKKAIDYASGILFYDNFDLMRRVLKTSSEADKLMKLANELEAFVKSNFEGHIGTNITRIRGQGPCSK